jgi:hypothetical protein
MQRVKYHCWRRNGRLAARVLPLPANGPRQCTPSPLHDQPQPATPEASPLSLPTPLPQDLEFINKMIDKTAIERLQHVAGSPFKRITYTEAIELLEKAVADGHKFEYPVGAGCWDGWT